jgi:hypothetical protein
MVTMATLLALGACSDDSESAGNACDVATDLSVENASFPNNDLTNREWRAKVESFAVSWRSLERAAPADVRPDFDRMASRFESVSWVVPDDDEQASTASIGQAFPYEDEEWVASFENVMDWIRSECS